MSAIVNAAADVLSGTAIAAATGSQVLPSTKKNYLPLPAMLRQTIKNTNTQNIKKMRPPIK